MFWAFTTLELILQTTRFLILKVSRDFPISFILPLIQIKHLCICKWRPLTSVSSTAPFPPVQFPTPPATQYLSTATYRLAIPLFDFSNVERRVPVVVWSRTGGRARRMGRLVVARITLRMHHFLGKSCRLRGLELSWKTIRAKDWMQLASPHCMAHAPLTGKGTPALARRNVQSRSTASLS